MDVKILELLLTQLGPVGVVAAMIFYSMRKPPAAPPSQVTGLSDGDKLWFCTEILGPIKAAIHALDLGRRGD